MSAGPFETERQAREVIGYPGRPYPSDDANEFALLDACARAGVQLGEYDRRIIAWLAGWEPATCAVVAGIILRAADHA